MPPVHRRAEWGADERLMTWTPEYAPAVRAVALHHTATGNDYAQQDVPRLLRSIYYFQAVSLGWGDIGYSVLVDRFGRLWEGRQGGLARPVVGGHAGGFNVGTAGLALLGDHRSVPVTPAAAESAARYVAWKLSLGAAVDPRGSTTLTGGGPLSRFPAGSTVTVPRVFPHRHTSPTECPGARGVELLGALRERAYQHTAAWADPTAMRMRLAVWRPGEGQWQLSGAGDVAWTGSADDRPVPADYDGDGAADLATWTPATATWTIQYSAGGTTERLVHGVPGDVPVPADYDGDGRAEPATFTPETATWHHRGAADVVWGERGDRPVPADYTGDGRADRAVWRAEQGTWHVQGGAQYRLGEAWHIPVPADYDGDGRVEPAAWSPLSHKWFLWGAQPVEFGGDGDVPVPGQYNGDGRADLAVWRAGTWRIHRVGTYSLGRDGDAPVPLG
jgi:hypothetical protein